MTSVVLAIISVGAYFDQIIRISTDDYLEGFEPVDLYENESSYWVYYRISKATYVEKKELKKQQALEAAKLKIPGRN